MATLEVTLLDTVRWYASGFGDVYAELQEQTAADSMGHNSAILYPGQGHNPANGFYIVRRAAVRFDLSELPTGADITAATLKLYGQLDHSVDDFDITVVGGDFALYPIYSDYSKGEAISYGTINSSACSVGAYNNITINTAGLVALNDAISTGEIELYLRSAEDIAASQPTDLEYYQFRGYDDANPPVLEATYNVWGDDVYPAVPVFPLQGSIDLETYAVIKDYLEGLDRDLSATTDGNGNVDLAVDNYIWWTGTSEQVGYDDTNSRVTLTTLESTSAITLAADLVTADPSITTTGTAVDCTVANDALLSDTAYASIETDVADNEAVFDAISAPTTADDEGDIYMDSTSGDLMLKTRDDGQAGVKTDILADFSLM